MHADLFKCLSAECMSTMMCRAALVPAAVLSQGSCVGGGLGGDSVLVLKENPALCAPCMPTLLFGVREVKTPECCVFSSRLLLCVGCPFLDYKTLLCCAVR